MPIVSSKSLHSDGVSIAGMKTASVAERPHPICRRKHTSGLVALLPCVSSTG